MATIKTQKGRLLLHRIWRWTEFALENNKLPGDKELESCCQMIWKQYANFHHQEACLLASVAISYAGMNELLAAPAEESLLNTELLLKTFEYTQLETTIIETLTRLKEIDLDSHEHLFDLLSVIGAIPVDNATTVMGMIIALAVCAEYHGKKMKFRWDELARLRESAAVFLRAQS